MIYPRLLRSDILSVKYRSKYASFSVDVPSEWSKIGLYNALYRLSGFQRYLFLPENGSAAITVQGFIQDFVFGVVLQKCDGGVNITTFGSEADF